MTKVEFGDFQTPDDFARKLVELLRNHGFAPDTIIEPTCGTGSFLDAAASIFPEAAVRGYEVQEEYVALAKARLGPGKPVTQGNFFEIDWKTIVDQAHGSLLFLGNPPWVTNSGLGSLGSLNLPEKTNLKGLSGLDALTGKSNFDISEWMILRILQCLQERGGALAFLCKTAVARKTIKYAADNNYSLSRAFVFKINANKVFGVAVDACFFVFKVHPGDRNYSASVFESEESPVHTSTIGVSGGQLVADFEQYEATKEIDGRYRQKWRSGVKHDCSKVMEFHVEPDGLYNGLGELVDIEPDLLYPLLKSSDLANGRAANSPRRILMTQSSTGEETASLAVSLPKTWSYLNRHSSLLDARRSSIYKGRPRFCIFGVGDYAFAPWKVAISGLYKSLNFQVIEPLDSKPVMLDDTCYFLGCHSEEEAVLLAEKVCSRQATAFLNSLIFWDSKRPVTVDILQRLDLDRLTPPFNSPPIKSPEGAPIAAG